MRDKRFEVHESRIADCGLRETLPPRLSVDVLYRTSVSSF